MSDPTPSPFQNDPPGALNYQGNDPAIVARDTEHMRILMICWYVFASLAGLFGFFPVIYLVVGLIMVYAPAFLGPGPPTPLIGWIMVGFAIVFMLLIWAGAVLCFFAAHGIRKRRWLTVCYIAAGFACLMVPVGTLLGIFTFIVLSRPTAKATFK